jgi:hypothetical protein
LLWFFRELKPSSGKKTAFSTNGVCSTGGQHVEECKLIYYHLLVQSSSSSGSRASTIKADTLNVIEKKVGKGLKNTGTGENFLNRTPMAYALRSRIDKWDLIKLQSFCKAKKTNKQNANQQTGERSSPILHPIEG